jgi:hypothetical protein
MINLLLGLTIASPHGEKERVRNFFLRRNERTLRINEGSLFCQVIFSRIFLIFPNGPIMVFDVRGKIVGTVILGYEIKIRNRSGTDGSQKGVPARVTDGRGGKSGQEIGVIRSGFQQIFLC